MVGHHPVNDAAPPPFDDPERRGKRVDPSELDPERTALQSCERIARLPDERRRLTRLVDADQRPRAHVAGGVHRNREPQLIIGRERMIARHVACTIATASYHSSRTPDAARAASETSAGICDGAAADDGPSAAGAKYSSGFVPWRSMSSPGVTTFELLYG